jgi:hypothetical protein
MTKFGQLAKAVDQNRKVLDLYDEYLVSKRSQRKEAEVLHWLLTKNLGDGDVGGRDRSGYWSASSAGRCSREQQFTYLGFTGKATDVQAQNIFDNGDFLHLRYQVAGIIGGWLTDAEVPVMLANDGVRVKGTMDGVLEWGEVLELKSINARGFAEVVDLGPKRLHRMQATAYMLASGMKRTRFVYENKDRNTNAEFVFDLEYGYEQLEREQWDLLTTLTNLQELAPRQHDCINERGMEWRYCQFQKICEQAKFPVKKLVLT